MKKKIFIIVLLIMIGVMVFSLNRLYTKSDTDSVHSQRTDKGYFDILKSIRDKLRKNPDHLPARYQEIVKNGNPDELIRFLRKRFDIILSPRGFSDADQYVNSGTYGALHGGMATPLELTLLLYDGVQAMGYRALLVNVKAKISDKRLYRSHFDKSEFEKIEWSKLKSKVGGLAQPKLPPYDDHKDLWKRIEDSIPNHAIEYQNSFPSSKEWLPTVYFCKDEDFKEKKKGAIYTLSKKDKCKVANLWGEDDSLYSYHDFSTYFHKRYHPRKIKLELLAKTTTNSWYKLDKLLEVELNEEQIAGSNIRVGFAPLLSDPNALLTTKPSQVGRFQAFIKIEGDNPALKEAKTDFFGDIIDIKGKIGKRDNQNKLRFDDIEIAENGDKKDVKSLKILDIDTSEYPLIHLQFNPLDLHNKVVTSLTSNSFRVKIDGQPAALNLRSNRYATPKILFLIDGSTSVAPEYRADKLYDIVLKMSKAIQQYYPKAKFKVMNDDPYVLMREWSSNPELVAKEASKVGISSNQMWKSIMKATDIGVDAIIFFTDGNDVDNAIQRFGTKPGGGVTFDELPNEYKNKISFAPATYTLGGERLPKYPLGAAFEEIPKATGGKAFKIVDHKQAIESIIKELQSKLGVYQGYVIGQNLNRDKNHSLSISVNDTAASAIFKVPDLKQTKKSDSIQGLYLKIKREDLAFNKETIHHLAGAAYKATPNATDEKNARLGLFGQYILVAQTGTPSASQILDALITERLSYKEVLSAKAADEMLEAMAKIKKVARTQYLYNLPLSHMVYESGLRYWLDIQQSVIMDGKEKLVKRTDILPLALYSAKPYNERLWRDIFYASQPINNKEAQVHQTDMGCMDGELIMENPFKMQGERKEEVKYIQNNTLYGYYVVVPKERKITCLMQIDARRGSALFKTPLGGAGMTVADVDAQFDQIDSILEASGELGGQIAAWASFEQAKMKLLRFATIAIVTMKTEAIEDMIRSEACDRLRGAVDGVIDDGVGAIGGVMGRVWEAIGEVSDIGESLGLGGIDTSVPIPGCD